MDDRKIKETMARHLPKLHETAKLYPSLLKRSRSEPFTEEEIEAIQDKLTRDLLWNSPRRPL